MLIFFPFFPIKFFLHVSPMSMASVSMSMEKQHILYHASRFIHIASGASEEMEDSLDRILGSDVLERIYTKLRDI